MKIIVIILALLITSCGYQPIYSNKNTNDFIFNNISLTGNKEINRKIISVLPLKEKKTSETQNELQLSSNINIEETSKDSLGQVTSYRTTVKVELIIKDQTQIKKNKIFNKSFSYNAKENKFDLTEQQDQIKNNLIDEIINEILIYINL